MKYIILLLTTVTFLISGCTAGAPPQTHYYLLSVPNNNSQLAAPITVLVKLPQFLNQGTLVIQQDEQQVKPSHYQRWAAPLPGMISQYIQRRLQQTMTSSTDTSTITVIIDRFHGTQDGQVYFSGQWWENRNTATVHSFNYQATQQQSGFSSLITTLQQLLDSACNDIVQELLGKHRKT